MRIFLKNSLSLLFVLALLIPAAVFAEESDDDEYESENETEYAEEYEPVYVADYFSGTTLDLSQYAGKAIFMNFFTAWCPYCMEEMPDIRAMYDLYDPDSLEIILVHPWNGEDGDATAGVVESYGLEGMNIFEDEDLTVQYAVGVPGYPTSIFIDQDGYLFYAVASMLDYDTMTSVLDAMGVPLRDGAEPAATPAPVPAASNPDAISGATPHK